MANVNAVIVVCGSRIADPFDNEMFPNSGRTSSVEILSYHEHHVNCMGAGSTNTRYEVAARRFRIVRWRVLTPSMRRKRKQCCCITSPSQAPIRSTRPRRAR